MKKLLPFLLISTLGLSVTAQTKVASTNPVSGSVENQAASHSAPVPGEDALVLTEKEFNFGKIPQGKPVVHIFEVTDNGKDSLHIVNVQASCGCTTPEWDRNKVLAPGEKTNIKVGYNAASEGLFSKQINITYNGTQTKQLIIKGDVFKTPSTSAPENKELGNLKN